MYLIQIVKDFVCNSFVQILEVTRGHTVAPHQGVSSACSGPTQQNTSGR